MDAHEPCVPVDDAARVHRDSGAGPRHLASPRPAAELRGQLDHLRESRGSEGVAPTDEAAAGVHDEPGESTPVAPASVAGPASPGAKKPSDSRA